MNNLPQGWEWKRLGDVCEEDKVIVNGSDSDLPFLGMEMIESGTGEIDFSLQTTEGTSACYYFDIRHVLYGKLRPYLNKVCLPDSAGRCSTELIPLLPKKNTCREYLAYLLRREETVEYAMTEKSGSRMPRANMHYLLNLPIPLPPLPEQRRIAAMLDKKLSCVETVKTKITEQLAYVNALPAAILRKAFRGEL